MLIFSNVARQHNVRTQRGSKLFYATFQFLILIGECQFRAFAVHCLRDAVGDGQFAGDASDQNALTGRKPIALILIVAYFYFNNHNVNIVISK